MATSTNLDAMRADVLDRMERGNRLVQGAILGAAVVEGALVAVAFYMVNWDDRIERLLFVFFVLSYTIVGFGLLALAGHVSRVGARVLAALDADRAA